MIDMRGDGEVQYDGFEYARSFRSKKWGPDTGFMSNRGRQNVASFLTKDLGYNWQHGAEFFEAYLSDYDANSNYGNWQYVAGVGNDPRSSRQFNPIKQGKD